MNLLQLGLLMPISLVLTRCDTSESSWARVYAHLRSIFSLELAPTSHTLGCQILVHYELFIAGSLLLIVVANLVGSLERLGRK